MLQLAPSPTVRASHNRGMQFAPGMQPPCRIMLSERQWRFSGVLRLPAAAVCSPARPDCSQSSPTTLGRVCLAPRVRRSGGRVLPEC